MIGEKFEEKEKKKDWQRGGNFNANRETKESGKVYSWSLHESERDDSSQVHRGCLKKAAIVHCG